MNVYILSLAAPGLNDTNLLDLLNNIPPHTILLMEDIDAVFKTALTESKEEPPSAPKELSKDTSNETNNEQGNGFNQNGGGGFGGFGGGGFGGANFGNNNANRALTNQSTRLTFAGILNALDGIAAQTGRLLFMTTNHKERLDAALIRPGRIDYQLYFEEATCEQIRLLFINFYRSIILLNAGIDVNDVIVDTTSDNYINAINQVEKLATEFANQIPDKTYTMSQIQGIFMMHRQDPQQAVNEIQNELLNLETSVLPPIPSLALQMSTSIPRSVEYSSDAGNIPPPVASSSLQRFGSSSSTTIPTFGQQF